MENLNYQKIAKTIEKKREILFELEEIILIRISTYRGKICAKYYFQEVLR